MIARTLSALVVLSLAGCTASTEPEDSEVEDGSSVSEGVSAIPEGDYILHPVHSNKCVDISAASKANGAKVQQWSCNGTVAQVFHVVPVDGDFVRITNPNSDKSLDITDVSYADGAKVQQWGYGGGANQQFCIVALGNGEYAIRARHTDKALDVSGWSQDDGAPLIQWPFHGGANQRFRFEKVGGGPAGWTLQWSDEFNGANGSAPDAGKWKNDIGGGGWGNNELQYYTNSLDNARVDNGNLVITATPDKAWNYGCWYGTCKYTSARLISAGKVEIAYGRIEARIQIPRGQGLWPAFWMLGNDIGQKGWPACGEIDIMENVGYEPGTVHGSLHGPGYSGNTPMTAWYTLPNGGALADGYHTYAVEWEPAAIRFYLDDVLYETRTPASLPAGTKWVYDHPFFLILNVAVGGGWPGSPDNSTSFPQQMKVDYVRVYKK